MKASVSVFFIEDNSWKVKYQFSLLFAVVNMNIAMIRQLSNNFSAAQKFYCRILPDF